MKKILLISYYWPPNAGVGARRWLNFQKHLSKNFSITVYTADNPNILNEDNKEVPLYNTAPPQGFVPLLTTPSQ